VSPATPLTSVSQLDPIKVTVPISEAEYMRFATHAGETDEERSERQRTGLELILAGDVRYPERGSVSVAGLAVNATTGTIDVQGVFPNPKNLLRPGQYARIRAVTDSIPGALVIPQRAVRDLQGASQVAVVGAEARVSFRNVQLGAATGSDYVVKQGLQAGERIVVEGLQKVRDGMSVKPVAAQPPPGPAGAPAAPEAAK
jgi:membrane fusion protein (multidrug efflux system)